jgi:copper chaperone NosL
MKSKTRFLFLLAPLTLVLLYFYPLWRITLEAPQYTEGINMYIWVDKITGDEPSTLQNINILNHYVGMRAIEPDSIAELKFFPWIVGAMIFLGIVVTFIGNPKLLWAWSFLMLILALAGVVDFYLWEYDYGHNLDPKAPIKVPGMVYQPPLIGSKWLLNFKAISWPHVGGIALGAAVAFGFVFSWIYTRAQKK